MRCSPRKPTTMDSALPPARGTIRGHVVPSTRRAVGEGRYPVSLDADPRLQPRAASEQLRPHAEQEYAHELADLQLVDDQPRPPHWRLSPWAVVRYLMGGPLPDGTMIRPKYVGARRLIEVAVATLATDRAFCSLAFRVRRSPGSPNIWPLPFRATRRCSCRARPALPKKPCGMDGTTPVCWLKVQVRRRSSPHR